MRTLALALLTATLACADGGVVLQHREAAPFVVTVFESPASPRAGTVDLSVLVQTPEALEPVLDAAVEVALRQGDSEVVARATHDQAQNKLLYATSVQLNQPGTWHYLLLVKKAAESTTVSGDIAISEGEPKLTGYAGYLALPFVCLVLFAIHQALRARKLQLGSSLSQYGR